MQHLLVTGSFAPNQLKATHFFERDDALDNARTARTVVHELFQDLDSFRLDDYQQMDDGGEGMARLLRYFQATVAHAGGKFTRISDTHFDVALNGEPPLRVTTNREAAKEDEDLTLLGLEHPLVKRLLQGDRQLDATARAIIATVPETSNEKGILTIWHVQMQDTNQRYIQRIVPVGLDEDGNRCPRIERLADSLRNFRPVSSSEISSKDTTHLVSTVIPEMLRRDLAHKGFLSESVTLSCRLLAWVELTRQQGTKLPLC